MSENLIRENTGANKPKRDDGILGGFVAGWSGGFGRELLPGPPPGAKMSPTSSIKEPGKVPGKKNQMGLGLALLVGRNTSLPVERWIYGTVGARMSCCRGGSSLVWISTWTI
jgi:hypothetical protein